MSIKGVRQMKELVIRYSDYDGSSRGVREWIRTNLVGFAAANPDLAVKTELKRCAHPFVQGHYANGNSKTICVKNLQPEGIEDFIFDLRNQIGRKVRQCVFAGALYRAEPLEAKLVDLH
jgi:large subunit ribosomal protein L43